ncbi:hypothetical protein [Nocardioides sp.]
MRRVSRLTLAALVGIGSLMLAVPTATAADTQPGHLVAASPAAKTPQVLNGRVLSIVQVGDTIVLGGSFTQVRDSGGHATVARNGLVAFSATTGIISNAFDPAPNAAVRVVLPAGDGTSVYVAGDFTSIGGVTRSRLAKVRVSDGAVTAAFNAGEIPAAVKDLRLTGGRLWVAGNFATVAGQARPALATVDPTTGALLPYFASTITGVHNAGTTNVAKIDVTPDGTRLLAIGNFAKIGGVTRSQLFMLNLTGSSATLANYATSFYTPSCRAKAFDTYLRDLDISPDGTFYVVSTTGGYGGPTSPCDTTARFETGASGTAVQPTWVDSTGGDTTYAVEVTDSVVYVGGHMRWQNNAYKSNAPGPGAVSRKGIGALEPSNGLPYSWNPTRTRGVGVFDFLHTDQGLWVGSDTTRIGGAVRQRVALMPSAGGTVIAGLKRPVLPANVYLGSDKWKTLARRSFTGNTAGGTASAPRGGMTWSNVRGAFMINGKVYLARSNGTFIRRTFNGSSYGAPVLVDTADELSPLTTWAADIKKMTGMFYDSGRIYFTRSGSTSLFYRYFNPQSDVVGTRRLVASGSVAGVHFGGVRGMFLAGQTLYFVNAKGTLYRATWADRAVAGAPVAHTSHAVSGPTIDRKSWTASALFVYQG